MDEQTRFDKTLSQSKMQEDNPVMDMKAVRKLLYKNQRKYYSNNKENIRDYAKKRRRIVLKAGDHKCDECNKAFYDKTSLNAHLKIKKHNKERYVHYKCPFEWCGYETHVKARFERHKSTRKHAKNTFPDDN